MIKTKKKYKIKTHKKYNFFPIILAPIVLFFSIVIFLSIPVLFNYKSIESQIEKKFYSEFNINIKILDEVKYQFIPLPHLLIKKANLNLNSENTNSSIIKSENLKLFISPRYLYSKSNLQFYKLEIQNTNFMFKLDDLKSFRNHLYNKINKKIIIKKSKFFYLDKDNNTILISPINKLFFLINKKDNFKKLKIKGNIFDIDYESLWKRYYETPNKSQTEIKFRNPNILVENFIAFENKSKFSGKSSINFLNEIIHINYFVDVGKIRVESPDLNQKIKISSNIELNPFYFESNITFIEKKLKFLIDDFLYFLLHSNPEFLGNLNGSLTINLENVNNELINKGKINLLINEKSIKLKKTSFKIDGGLINSKISYNEEKGDLIFTSKNVFEIKNKKEFAKKFQINLKKIKNIDSIFFNLKKNIDTGKISISKIQINNINNKKEFNDVYSVNNIQELKILLKRILST